METAVKQDSRAASEPQSCRAGGSSDEPLNCGGPDGGRRRRQTALVVDRPASVEIPKDAPQDEARPGGWRCSSARMDECVGTLISVPLAKAAALWGLITPLMMGMASSHHAIPLLAASCGQGMGSGRRSGPTRRTERARRLEMMGDNRNACSISILNHFRPVIITPY